MKGVSSLISTVVLISISVIIASLIIIWSTTFLVGESKTISSRTQRAVECSSAEIDIVDVFINFNTNTAHVFVENSGSSDDDIIAAFVRNNEGLDAVLLSTLPASLEQGSLKKIDFDVSSIILQCSDFSYLEVHTNCKTASYSGQANC